MLDLRAVARAPLLVRSPLEAYASVPLRQLVSAEAVFSARGDGRGDDNVVVVLEAAQPERLLRQAAAFFAGAPYAVVVEVGQADELEHALRATGWVVDEEEPALVLAPLPAAIPAPPAELHLRRVVTESQLAHFIELAPQARRWLPSLQAALDPAVAALVGYLGERPVATARVACLGAVADLTGVVTAPPYRRRGYGTAMTWAAIGEAARRGCRAVTLTATAMGYPVYRLMGFEPVCSYRSYVRSPS